MRLSKTPHMETSQIFSQLEFNNRHKKLHELVSDDELAILFARADITYYSGTGLDGVLVAGNELKRYVKRNLPLAKEESVLSVNPMESFRVFKEIASNHNVKRLKLELDILPYKSVEYIKKAFNDPIIIDISTDLRMIRSVKSKEEQTMMKTAAKQTDESFEHAREFLKPGISEVEVCGEIEKFLRINGHPGFVEVRMFRHNYSALAYVMAGESTRTLNTSFGPVSGQGNCRMHKTGPSKRKFKNDEAVLIDTTGVYEGYTADETRTFFIGKVPEIHLDAYEVAKDIQKFVENSMKNNTKASTLYDEIQYLVKETPFANNFMGIDDDIVPFIGHGVGLELDEFPIITPNYKDSIYNGQIVAIEPKMIFNQPIGGVGIEDTYIVTENGSERITLTPW